MVSAEVGGLVVPTTLLQSLPAVVLHAEQYFGSFVRLTCVAADGNELELRVYLADWRFSRGGGLLADSEGAAKENNLHLTGLKGQQLLHVVAGESEVILDFTDAFSLRVVANLEEYEPDDELLLVYLDTALVKFFPTIGFVLAPPVARS
jgi:hypothetical protein